MSTMKTPEPLNCTVVLSSRKIGLAMSDAMCRRAGQSTTRVKLPPDAAATAAATAAVSSVCPSHVAQCDSDFVTTAAVVVVEEVELEEVELEELVLVATVVVVEAGAVDAVEAVEVLVLLVVVVVVVSLDEALELRSITPLLLPVSAAAAAVAVDWPESDPPDPQADSTTQHASADMPYPGKRCIERLGKRLKWPIVAGDRRPPQCLGTATTCLYVCRRVEQP